jgi:hypothetical protein
MALKSIRGKSVLESVGPVWRLVGTIKRDKSFSNRLTLSRKPDELSSWINASGRRFLPAVQLTDPSGSTFMLTNAQMVASNRPSGRTSKLGSGTSEHNTNLLENYSFVFQSITVENMSGSTSRSDDWTQNNN